MPRPCKYGARDASGKCPPKPKDSNAKTAKKRSCKYGLRDASGKCPPKPKGSNSTRKKRSCKYGQRDASGKCPPKPKGSTKKEENAKQNTEKQIIITRDNLYQVGNNTYFKIKIGNVIYRDIDVDIKKNNRFELIPIAKLLGINNATNIKKSELVEIVNNKLKFEK